MISIQIKVYDACKEAGNIMQKENKMQSIEADSEMILMV